MHYQGYQSNNKQPAGPLILHISVLLLKFFHAVGGGYPPHPPLLARSTHSCTLHSHYAPPHFQSCSKAYVAYGMWMMRLTISKGTWCSCYSSSSDYSSDCCRLNQSWDHRHKSSHELTHHRCSASGSRIPRHSSSLRHGQDRYSSEDNGHSPHRRLTYGFLFSTVHNSQLPQLMSHIWTTRHWQWMLSPNLDSIGGCTLFHKV